MPIVKHKIYFLGQVLIPKGAYNGQKLIKEVAAKMMAKTPSTSPNVPEITFVKYSTAMTAATIKRIVLSKVPMFGFI